MLFENEQFNISQIHYVVYYDPKPRPKYVYRGNLPYHELAYYDHGEVELAFYGKSFHLCPGDIMYLPKGIDNHEYVVYAEDGYSCYNIYFDTADELPKEPVKISVGNDNFKAFYEKIYRTWIGKRSGYYYSTMQQAYNIIEQLRKFQGRYAPDCRFMRLARAEEYMAEHYFDTHFDYNQMVAQTDLSYSYFKKLFVDKYGCPPVKYVTRLKIDRACELLATESYSVSEIAKLCGFDNVYYFSNVFKKQKGVSPNHYFSPPMR